jgi:putative Mg2+ transporter-C (MgtC) family protein
VGLPPLAEAVDVCEHLVFALLAGGLIGIERSYHGRPAGFRTHTLVCLASSLLMLVTLYQSRWFVALGLERISVDPTRMAQGIMTGIGFLGAGVIMKEGLSVRGLTTAASIWITAAIGILIGIGLYFPAAAATALSVGVLSLFRLIEAKLPRLFYAQLTIRCARAEAISEDDLRAIVDACGFTTANLSYRQAAEGQAYEYRMSIRARHAKHARALAAALQAQPTVLEFRLTPTGD